MKKYVLTGILVLLAVGSVGYANIMTIQMSYFVPRAQSGARYADSLWTVEFQNMTFTKTNFEDVSFGLSYEIILTNQFSLVFGLDTYSKNRTGYYKDYIGFTIDNQDWALPSAIYQGGYTPQHNFSVSITPIQLSLKIAPFGRRQFIVPYVGGGVALYFSRIRLRGDMIDFSTYGQYTDETDGSVVPIYPIYYVDAWEEGSTIGKISFGWQVFGGFMVPVTNRFSIDAGFKYASSRVKLGEAFQGFGLFDLGSYQISLGVNYWF